ncbi:MarR family winged helix-turn-helix transcriptional regulator [Blastococcus sp. TF02A-26]|uniref:MarR family winged helix-turn-helix transcriptional regulator n=1 Tax=Blastococcus sp. TF02A-26 TaxID=2250577 RepID=UPI0013149152|nr:MarR family transcriptional regulator [Blastococcus sp. TF02A-26]
MTEDDVALLTVARAVVGISARAAGRLGAVSVAQLRALTLLRDLPGAPLARLAAELGVTVSTASRSVERLVGAGLVDRRVVPTNRRAVELHLTPVGEDLLTRYDQSRLAELRAWLDRVPRGGRAAVGAALADLAAVAGGAAGVLTEELR